MDPVVADAGGDTRQRGFRVAAGFLQLVNHAQQHVELADPPEPIGDFAQPTAELAGHVGVELQDGQHLAEAAGRHARAVQRADVAVFDAL